MATSVFPAQVSRELCRVLRQERYNVAEEFSSALALMPRWKLLIEREQAQRDAFLQDHFFIFVDYLVEYFRTGDSTYKQLFVGEKIKALYDAELDELARKTQIEAVNRAERQGLVAVLQSKLSTNAWNLLSCEIGPIHLLLENDAAKDQHVLLVGDCIFLDIIPFIVGDLLTAGIRLVFDYATSKNPLELRDQLRKLSVRKFDL